MNNQYNQVKKLVEESDLRIIKHAFEMLAQVELTDLNRQLISRKYIELMSDEEDRLLVDEEVN
jgi:hypothetical protein